MWGGIAGLTYVSQDRWGGLPVTLILATFGLAFGFPLGIVVALGRRSKLPAIRSLCVLYVELIRGVPLISLLFMASVMFPLFMPDGVNIDKLLRAQIAFVLYAGAYLAEVVRGGLQAVPRGQHDAADALGLSYWKKNGLIILPQAIRHVIPPLVNTFIAFFKDTSLVLIIGIFDLLTTAKTSIIDPAWQPFSVEVYVFVGLIYFVFCFAMSRYSRGLEAQERDPPSKAAYAALMRARKRPTSLLSASDSAARPSEDCRTSDAVSPVWLAAFETPTMLLETFCVPEAACWMLRAISAVAAPCSSTAAATVVAISDILSMIWPMPLMVSTASWVEP
jgi:His/Glu/Gln/Arg/opine family amino acid ABC transporter permease subunit